MMKKTAMVVAVLALALLLSAQSSGLQRIAVVITAGHDTDPRDHGRPVALIAGALQVPEDVFREAFSHVTPAAGGREPEPEQVRLNKAALMRALRPYGVTNERLDEVSNRYRYNRSGGDLLWRHTPAAAYAIVEDGRITGFTITDGGSGYTSAPAIAVPGMPGAKATAAISFSKDFAFNGSLKHIGL